MSDKSIKGRSPILIKTHKRKIHNLPGAEIIVTDKFAAKVHEDARTGKKTIYNDPNYRKGKN